MRKIENKSQLNVNCSIQCDYKAEIVILVRKVNQLCAVLRDTLSIMMKVG